jgi:hypothetical protein
MARLKNRSTYLSRCNVDFAKLPTVELAENLTPVRQYLLTAS